MGRLAHLRAGRSWAGLAWRHPAATRRVAATAMQADGSDLRNWQQRWRCSRQPSRRRRPPEAGRSLRGQQRAEMPQHGVRGARDARGRGRGRVCVGVGVGAYSPWVRRRAGAALRHHGRDARDAHVRAHGRGSGAHARSCPSRVWRRAGARLPGQMAGPAGHGELAGGHGRGVRGRRAGVRGLKRRLAWRGKRQQRPGADSARPPAP
mmetsp:Transcript_15013/g.45979  ORF Transcript_15013/g.45979 Transcript_15013/m.45979 type:complete len:207 (+) Transcript_15013:1465-2085(+)